MELSSIETVAHAIAAGYSFEKQIIDVAIITDRYE
jgi:hypothetical protein